MNIKIESLKFGQVGTTRKKVLNDLKAVYGKIDYEFGFSTSQLKNTNSKIYLLLDADTYTKENINLIKSIFDKDDYIEVLFSNQDFELFVLLHLEYFNSTTNLYIDKIKSHYNDYDKGCSTKKREIHKKIIQEGVGNLKENILKLERLHGVKAHIKDKNPFSEVYKIYEDFE